MTPTLVTNVFPLAMQTAGGDINFSIAYTRKAKGRKKKHITVFPETRVDSYCDEHTRADAFEGAIDPIKALEASLVTFYASTGIDKDAESTARAAEIFHKRQVCAPSSIARRADRAMFLIRVMAGCTQDEMLAHLQSKYCKAEGVSKADASLRKKALHKLRKDLRRPPHLIHLEQVCSCPLICVLDLCARERSNNL